MFTIGPFTLLEPIGRGGMCEVWKGRHTEKQIDVAIKIILEENAKSSRFISSFRNEVRAVAGLHHPGIVMVFDYGQIPKETEEQSEGKLLANSPYLIMELANGTLKPFCGRLPWSHLKPILIATLDALAHAHAKGVIHRDIKPVNILLSDQKPYIKITDFGIFHAFQSNEIVEEGQTPLGTPSYMAPEQLLGKWRDFGPWTDLYAFGCTVFELLSGKTPYGEAGTFHSIMFSHMEKPIPRLQSTLPIPDGVEKWVRTLLQKEPGRRFQRAADALYALEHLENFKTSKAPEKREVSISTESLIYTASEMPAVPLLAEDSEVKEEPTLLDLEIPTKIQELIAPEADCDDLLSIKVTPQFPDWRMQKSQTNSHAALLHNVGLGLYGLRNIPIIGRESERDRMWHVLREVVEKGTPKLLLLEGIAGSGKSRLAEWLCEFAHASGVANSLKAVHSPASGPTEGLGPMIARFIRCVGLDRGQIQDRLQLHFPRAEKETQQYETLLELLSPPLKKTADIEDYKPRFGSQVERYEAITGFISQTAQERPVIIWIDDIQWGLESLQFVEQFFENSAKHQIPILFVLTARSEALAEQPSESLCLRKLLGQRAAQSIQIEGLVEEERQALLKALLGLESDLSREVEDRTGGNPLFMIQLIGDWVQRGILEPGKEGFKLKSGVKVELPEGLHQMWNARIDRVFEGRTQEQIVAMELAAILGQEVDVNEWKQACIVRDITIPYELHEQMLEQRLLLYSENDLDSWSFVHGMLRESLERRAHEAGRLQEHHLTCAKVVSELSGRGYAERLGRHYMLGGELEEAIKPFFTGSSERVELGDYHIAKNIFANLQGIFEALQLPESDERWGLLWLKMSRMYRALAETQEAESRSRKAEAHARKHGWKNVLAHALIECAHWGLFGGHSAQAKEWLEEAKVLSEECDDPLLIGKVYTSLGDFLCRRGELLPATEYYLLSVELFIKSDFHMGTGYAFFGLSNTNAQQGNIKEATTRVGQAYEYFEKCGHRSGLANCLNSLGDFARFQNQLSEAERYYRESLVVHEKLGSSHIIIIKLNLSLALIEQGKYQEARTLLEACIQGFIEGKLKPFEGTARACMLAALAGLQTWGSWSEHFEKATQLLTETGFTDVDPAHFTELAGNIAQQEGQYAFATNAYMLSSNLWRGLGRKEDVKRVHKTLEAMGTPCAPNQPTITE